MAERLVTADGFGCTSCHAIGKVKPRIAPLGALGPNLSMLGRRIRQTWFDRWVRNPARIVPKMEMPSVQIPVPGVLNEDLDTQLSAVWQVLNQPNFRPPDPHPVRIVRQSGMSAQPRAVVLTDVLKYRQQTFIKPFLIALPNRHNVLFDLSLGRLAGWWIGDTARQRTKGKAWYWDAVGQDVRTFNDSPDLVLMRDGKTFTPQRHGQFVTEPDAWTHMDGGGIELEHRLHFGTPVLATVGVKQTFTPLGQSSESESGWQREILVSGLASTDWIRFNSSGAVQRVTASSAIPVDRPLTARARRTGSTTTSKARMTRMAR